MDTPVIVAVISAAAAIVVPAISFYLTKSKERQADWQRYKFELYKDFIQSLSGIVGTDSTPEGNRRFAAACNTLHLIAPKGVLDALHDFRMKAECRMSTAATKDTTCYCPAWSGKSAKTYVFRTIPHLTDSRRGCGVQGAALLITPANQIDTRRLLLFARPSSPSPPVLNAQPGAGLLNGLKIFGVSRHQKEIKANGNSGNQAVGKLNRRSPLRAVALMVAACT